MDNLIQLAMQIIFCLLIAALLGAIIGYLLGKMGKCDKDDDTLDTNLEPKELHDYNKKEAFDTDIDKTSTIAATGMAAVSAVKSNVDSKLTPIKNLEDTHVNMPSIGQEIGIRPESVKIPESGDIDDIKEISGIGLKIEEILNSLGIYYFEQISEWTPENIDWIENYLSLKRRVKKENWIGQAKLLAAGNHTEFSKKVKRGDNRNY